MKMKNSVYTIIVLLACSMLFNIPQAYAGTYSVTFSAGEIYLDTRFTVRLDFKVLVKTGVPTVYAGGEGSMNIDIFPDIATIFVDFHGDGWGYGGGASFPTPIGSYTEADVFSFLGEASGKVYVKATGNIRTKIEVEGSGYISPTSISWTSEGSKSVSISHTGSVFSFGDSIKVTIPFTYVLNLTIGVNFTHSPPNLSSFEISKNTITLTGTPIIIENIPIVPIAIIVVIVVVVVGLVGIAVIAKRKKKPV